MFKLITDTMTGAGDIVFANLALLFAIGVAIGLTGDAGVAALAGTVGFLVMNKVINVFMGITSVNTVRASRWGTHPWHTGRRVHPAPGAATTGESTFQAART